MSIGRKQIINFLHKFLFKKRECGSEKKQVVMYSLLNEEPFS